MRTLYGDIAAERERAHAKHAETSLENEPVEAPIRRDVLVEEVGEIAREFNDARHERRPVDHARLRTELVQTAAMCAAWIAAIDGMPLAPVELPEEAK